jgi:hypothetical protein
MRVRWRLSGGTDRRFLTARDTIMDRRGLDICKPTTPRIESSMEGLVIELGSECASSAVRGCHFRSCPPPPGGLWAIGSP